MKKPSGVSLPAKGAEFSPNRSERYLLWRIWREDKRRMCFVGFNPSIADASRDDATIRRMLGFAAVGGFGGLEVVNLYPRVSSNPKMPEVRHLDRYSMQRTVEAYIESFQRCEVVVAGWGSLAKPVCDEGAIRSVIDMAKEADRELMCFGVTKRGGPAHPLYLQSGTKLKPWPIPEMKSRGIA